MSTSTAVTAVSGVSSEVKGVEVTEVKKEVAAVTEVKKEEVVAAAAAAVDEEDEEGDCDCEECQGGFAEYEEEGGWIDELGVDDHDFY
jgi:hypothetical protein